MCFTTVRCSVGHIFSILTCPRGVRSKELVEEESQWYETTSEVKLFAGTKWCLPWHPSLPPHKAGHLGSEFEKKLVLEKKRMQGTHLPPETIPLSIVTPGTVIYTGRALVGFVREDGECRGPELTGCEM